MNLTDINDKLYDENGEYKDIWTNPHTRNKLMFLVLGGSYSYGTNVETSDVDIRGCALNSKSDILGLSNFEQFIKNDPDITIYSFIFY